MGYGCLQQHRSTTNFSTPEGHWRCPTFSNLQEREILAMLLAHCVTLSEIAHLTSPNCEKFELKFQMDKIFPIWRERQTLVNLDTRSSVVDISVFFYETPARDRISSKNRLWRWSRGSKDLSHQMLIDGILFMMSQVSRWPHEPGDH